MIKDPIPQKHETEDITNERAQLCREITPRVFGATSHFNNPDKPHPFLHDLGDGGIIYSHPERDNIHTEPLTLIEAKLAEFWPGDYEAIGIPQHLAEKNQVWSVNCKDTEYEKDPQNRPGEREGMTTSYCLAYWNEDDSVWLAKRWKDAEGNSTEGSWVDSEPTEEELRAIRVVASQTHDAQRIADVFGDRDAFEAMFLKLLEEEYGLTGNMQEAFRDEAFGTYRYPDDSPAYPHYYQTVYHRSSRHIIEEAGRNPISLPVPFQLDKFEY